MARPSNVDQWLTEDGLSLLRYFKQTGMTDAQIASKIGISERQLSVWKKKFPQISSAIKKGREYAIADAYKALTSMFKVQTLVETTTQRWTDPSGKEHETVTVRSKEIPPDKGAVIFYLKSQAGWRDNYEVVDSSDSDKVFEMLKQTQELAESLPDLTEETDESED